MNLCDSCETVSHCTAHGCIPLTECINSGQVSAAQVVAHAEAGECVHGISRYGICDLCDSPVPNAVNMVTPNASAPSQPAAMVNLAAETPTQKGARATLAVQGLSKAFDGLGSGRKDRKMKVTDEMVNRFLMWKLPAGFSPDCGISFKPESDYEHPVFGRSKHEPMGTNLFSADQARAMLEHVLTDIQPAAPVELPVVDDAIRAAQKVQS